MGQQQNLKVFLGADREKMPKYGARKNVIATRSCFFRVAQRLLFENKTRIKRINTFFYKKKKSRRGSKKMPPRFSTKKQRSIGERAKKGERNHAKNCEFWHFFAICSQKNLQILLFPQPAADFLALFFKLRSGIGWEFSSILILLPKKPSNFVVAPTRSWFFSTFFPAAEWDWLRILVDFNSPPKKTFKICCCPHPQLVF